MKTLALTTDDAYILRRAIYSRTAELEMTINMINMRRSAETRFVDAYRAQLKTLQDMDRRLARVTQELD